MAPSPGSLREPPSPAKCGRGEGRRWVRVADGARDPIPEGVGGAEEARHERIDAVVAASIHRALYRIVDDQDFTGEPRPYDEGEPGDGIVARGAEAGGPISSPRDTGR